MAPRLKAEIWVKAHIRICSVQNIPVFVTRRGDDAAGAVLIKVNRLNNMCMVLIPTTDFSDGSRKWLKGTGADWVDENTADIYIEKQVKFDRDCWVIEIEDQEGRHFLEEKVEA
ncbi:MAG: DUF1491 family protein [Sneathiella sp.]